MTPQGHYAVITKGLARLARTADLPALNLYLGGPFRAHIASVEPGKIGSVLAAVERAKAACTTRTRLPVPAKPISRHTKKAPVDWKGNPALRARLAHLYAKHGPTNYRAVAADMRMSIGQVRLAKRRFIDAAATRELARAA